MQMSGLRVSGRGRREWEVAKQGGDVDQCERDQGTARSPSE